GVDKNNINIEATKDNLSIKGWETKNAGNSHSSASFSFTTSIPVDADSNNISADFNEDILKISIPKLKSSKSKTQKIIIK
ncbi:MAG: Hsp20 family protein, partial [Candidatus Thioglobus sp.]